MPPETTARSCLKVELDLPYPSSPSLELSDKDSYVPANSLANMTKKPRWRRLVPSKDVDGENVDPELSAQNLGGTATGARSKDVSSSEAEANNPYSSQFPLSHQVFDLEKRAQELQDKCEFFQEQCHELTSTLERSNEAIKKERSDHKTKYKSLEAVNDVISKQLEEEKEKAKELQAQNESLAADLAAASEEKTMLSKMLEEKTYESWVFRCAVTVIYKLSSSAKERVSMRDLLRDVLASLREKYQQERAAREQDQAQDQNNSDRVSEEAAERSESSL